jgi:hypothetical protein
MSAPIQLAEIARIAEMLSVMCDDDEQLFHDMLIGESDIDRIIGKLHNQLASDSELVAGIAARQSDLADRKRRLADRTTVTKAAIGQFLRAAQLSKIELPEATYSVRDGKPSLRVLDADAVPPELCRAKIDPDKTKINEAFADAETLPNWLARDPARDVVTARTK